MNTTDAIEQRRAVKHYDPNHKMEDEEIEKLIQLAMLSPTSFNMQNWRFLVVDDPEIRKELRDASFDQAQVTDASIVILMCADLMAWSQEPQRYWRNAPQEAQDILVPWMGKFYTGNEQGQRDEALRSIGIASQTIMLSAKDMGYDSCPMIGFDPEKVAKIVNLPENHLIGMMITVGKASKPAWGRPGQLEMEEVFVKNKF